MSNDSKRAERKISTALRYSRNILAAIREPLIILDSGLQVVFANKSFYNTFKVSEGDTEDQLIYDLGNRQWDIPALRSILEDILPNQIELADFEITHEFETIGKKTMLLNATRIIAGEEELILLAIEDITTGKNAPIFGIDINGQVNEWNQTAERITGYSKVEVVGHNLVDEFITQDYKASVKEILNRALEGEETANCEFPLYTKSGEQVEVLINSTTRRDAEGTIVGVIGVGQDIAGRKHAEEQVMQVSRLATLGEMVVRAAHELNQPLNVIQIAVGNSLRKIRKGSAEPEYLSGKLEKILAQTERAVAIINHMRMFGRKAVEEPSPINPRDVVRGAPNLMGEQPRLAEEVNAEAVLYAHHADSRILLVEDDAINREVTLELLGSVGLAMESVENGRQAVESVRDKDYDLILMDIQMPEMDGMEATRMIRAMAGNADIPVLAMTANTFEEDRQACLEAGMNDFVTKPVDPENLFSIILKWLPKSAA